MSHQQQSVECWVLCERYQHVTGEWADWDVVDGVAASSRRDWLTSFEREANGEQVSERRVFRALVQVES